MKQTLSMLLAAILLMACLPLNVFTANAEQSDILRRYTVLLLDVSAEVQFMDEDGEIIYTANPAIDYVKSSASRFLSALGRASGENQVAVIAYDDEATVVTDFTTNISDAQERVEALTVQDDFTNISGALNKANLLLNGVSVENAVKNVVLVTTGMTNSGPSSYDGRYNDDTVGSEWQRMDTEISLYAYANKAFQAAETLKSQATIYVLGLFQTMADVPYAGKSAADFFRLTARDIASPSQFYEVENPDDLDFTFGSIVNRILSRRGMFKYRGCINQSYNSQAEYYYSDSYFLNDPTEYNPSLATMSLCMELACWPAYNEHDNSRVRGRDSYSESDARLNDSVNWYNHASENETDFWTENDHLRNIKELFYGSTNASDDNPGIGFSHFEANEYWASVPTRNSIGVCAARKQIQDDDGTVYTLIALPIRGGGYGSEWASNLKVGHSGEHKGFSEARDKVLDFLDHYLSTLTADESHRIKLWITGYSRAGATANMVAGALDDNHPLPDNISLQRKDIFCYTFEAPQGAVKSTLPSYNNPYENPVYKNIHNIINMNDIVPMVAPSAWDFARYNYQKDHILPSLQTVSDFSGKRLEMFKELDKLGFGPNNWEDDAFGYHYFQLGYHNDFDFDYKIKEYHTLMTVDWNWDSIFPGGEPFVQWDASAPYTNDVLTASINSLANHIVESREYYKNYIETELCNFLEIKSNYYGISLQGIEEPSTEEIDEKLMELFSCETYLEILAPLFDPSLSIANQQERCIALFTARLPGIFGELANADLFINALKDLHAKIITCILNDLNARDYESLINHIYTVSCSIRSLCLQSHYPEICLAWVRSQDPNYNPNAEDAFSSTLSRPIRINCPVDVEVYDSNHILRAAIRNNEPDNTIPNTLVAFVNANGEKIIYLPGDDTFDIRITATDQGEVNYSVSEYDYRLNETVRLENYYHIPVTTGDTLHAVVSAITEDGFVESTGTGSAATYTLDKNGTLLLADDIFCGAENVENETFDVVLKTEGNGGYAFGSGENFLKGSFAQMHVSMYPNGEFLGWYNGETLLSTDLQYRFAVTENITLTAKFNELQFNRFTLLVDGKGTLNRETGYCPADTEIKLKAEPDEDYEFICWTSSDDGIIENVQNSETVFHMPDTDTQITAHFRKIGVKPDWNNDSKINISDGVMLLRYISEDNIAASDLPDESILFAADLDYDSTLTISDFTLLLTLITNSF